MERESVIKEAFSEHWNSFLEGFHKPLYYTTTKAGFFNTWGKSQTENDSFQRELSNNKKPLFERPAFISHGVTSR